MRAGGGGGGEGSQISLGSLEFGYLLVVSIEPFVQSCQLSGCSKLTANL